MLELRRDEVTRVFVAPCQVKANNGILIIDDFGRQMVSPKELLNRWIVPLDQHVDFLTISSGMKFQMPFELMLVFSTNVDPSDLVDEAFLRRVQTKVFVPDVSAESFDRIFDLVVETEQVPSDAGCAAYLRDRCLTSGSRVLRACYPMDIYRLIKAITRYEGQPAAITTLNIDRAIELYFAKSGLMQQGKGWSAETQRQRAGSSLQSRPARREKTPV
jgi:predicted ATPase with chaperone activity